MQTSLLKNKPRLKYAGLTIIMSNPSRFDKVSLLCANGGVMFNNFCLRPELNSMQCEVRLTEDKSDFLMGTKCVLLLGERAMHEWCDDTKFNTLNELRGSPLCVRDLPAITSFLPQDAVDIVNHEKEHNPFAGDYEEDENETEDEDEGDVKAHGKTKRSNYAFWLRRDVWKCKQIISHGLPSKIIPEYKLYPPADEVINILTNTKGRIMDFDIETDYEEQNLLCFSFTFDGSTVYCVPVLNENYKWSYSVLPNILRALGIAFRDNIVVAHNGKSFDFPVLARKYSIAVHQAFDTMIAMNRIFPDIEKSLGHCISFWLFERFHKGMDSKSYFTREDMNKKLLYCGHDVTKMRGVRLEMMKFAKTIPGLEASIECAMRSIRPYIVCELQGIRYLQDELEKVKAENDIQMMQYLRWLKLLIGKDNLAVIKSQIKRGKAKAMPSSNVQCCYYFHEMLGYKVLLRSKKTNKPSLGKVIMYKLALTYPDNLAIRIILLYRILQKEYSSLKFIPYLNDNNKIIKRSDTIETPLEGVRTYSTPSNAIKALFGQD